MKFTRRKAFTLIELLTVIAIIGILAAIIIPTVSSVKTSANNSRTKVQFSQWSTAMGLFKQEYGYYPAITDTAKKLNPTYFSGALTGAKLAGDKYTSTTDTNLCGNKRMLSFYSISSSDLSEDKTKIVDAFGNTDIAVYIDDDSDGIINPSTLVSVQSIDDSSISASPDLPTGGIRAGVAFYSAGKGGNSETSLKSSLVTSW